MRRDERSDFEKMLAGDIPSRVYVDRMQARVRIRHMITPDRDVVAAGEMHLRERLTRRSVEGDRE